MRKVVMFEGSLTAEQPISYSIPTENKTKKDHVLPLLGDRYYLTASGLRGALRHAATEVVMDLLDARSPAKKLDLEDYFLLAMGGVKDAKNAGKKAEDESEPDSDGEGGESEVIEKDAGEADVVRYLRANQYVREHNPLVGLFGSMRHGVSGSLYCAHAVAPEGTQPVRVRYVRANDFQRDPELLERLGAGTLDAFIARQAAAATRAEGSRKIKELRQQSARAKKDGKASLVKEIAAEMDAVKAALPTDVQLQLPNLTYEALPAGTVFKHEFVLSNPTDAEVALFLRALDRLALHPLIGGHLAHGLGRVSGHWSVRMRAAAEREFAEMGEVSFRGDFTGLELTGPIAQFFESWNAVVAEKGRLDFTEAGIVAV